MLVIYADNFRGFNSLFLELKGVNFFLGENSTGKTSILKLIGILSSPGFWNYQSFNSQDFQIDLSQFGDIITMSSPKPYFDIGILEVEDKSDAIKLRFIEENNLPRLKEINVANSLVNLQISIEGKLLKYRYTLGNVISKEDLTYESFRSWIGNNGLRDANFRKDDAEFLGIKSILFQMQSILKKENPEHFSTRDTIFKFPTFQDNLAWTNPVRAEPLKTYDSFNFSFTPDGSHAPYVLYKLLNEKNDLHEILNKYGSDSGLYENISIKRLRESPNPNINERFFPFEINITLNGKEINITNVGYGVSQILPILIEMLGRPQGTWFTLQQPETHLHPRAQAALGDFLFKACERDDQKLIVETHSDYLIDRFRIRIKRASNENQVDQKLLAQIFFFTRNERGNHVEVITLNSDGSYPDNQPEGFRDFFVKEQLDLITI